MVRFKKARLARSNEIVNLERMTRILIIAFLVGLLANCSGPTTAAIIVRHAEKDIGVDPALTPAGEIRALALRDKFADTDIKAVYSTNFRRTRQTATPTAELHNLPVQIYQSARELVDQVLTNHEGTAVLIVGHTGLITDIVRAFGAQMPEPIEDGITEDDFDNIVITLISENGAAAFHTTYGEASP